MRPMEITTGSGLSIIGETADGTTEAEVEFDAIYFDFEFHPETIPECLIIVNGSDATLKNIKITNLPVGMHGICVKQSNDVLDAVKITSLNNDTARNPIITNNSEAESSGVVFFEGSTDSVLKSNSEIKGMDGYAVEFRRETSVYGSLSDSIIEAAGILVDDVLTQFVPTDENMFTTSAGETSGLVDLVTAEVSNKVVLKANSVDKLIKNDSSIAIVIKNIIQSDFNGSSSYWFVEGRVINSSVSYENSTICDDYTNNDTTKRIQIYTKDGFYNYVGAVGQDGTSGLYDQGDDAGYFNFYIPTSVGDQIALIPEGAGGKLGRPTPAIPMQSHDSDTGYSATAGFCPDVDNSGNHTSGGDGGGGGGAGGGVMFQKVLTGMVFQVSQSVI